MLYVPCHEQLSKSLLRILLYGTAVASSAFLPIQGFPPLRSVHISLLKKVFFSLHFCTARCNMLPHNGEESLLPVTFLHWEYPEF